MALIRREFVKAVIHSFIYKFNWLQQNSFITLYKYMIRLYLCIDLMKNKTKVSQSPFFFSSLCFLLCSSSISLLSLFWVLSCEPFFSMLCSYWFAGDFHSYQKASYMIAFWSGLLVKILLKLDFDCLQLRNNFLSCQSTALIILLNSPTLIENRECTILFYKVSSLSIC